MPRIEDWHYDDVNNSIEGYLFDNDPQTDGLYLVFKDVIDFDSSNYKVTTPFRTYTLGRPISEDAMSSPAFEQEFDSPFTY